MSTELTLGPTLNGARIYPWRQFARVHRSLHGHNLSSCLKEFIPSSRDTQHEDTCLILRAGGPLELVIASQGHQTSATSAVFSHPSSLICFSFFIRGQELPIIIICLTVLHDILVYSVHLYIAKSSVSTLYHVWQLCRFICPSTQPPSYLFCPLSLSLSICISLLYLDSTCTNFWHEFFFID